MKIISPGDVFWTTTPFDGSTLPRELEKRLCYKIGTLSPRPCVVLRGPAPWDPYANVTVIPAMHSVDNVYEVYCADRFGRTKEKPYLFAPQYPYTVPATRIGSRIGRLNPIDFENMLYAFKWIHDERMQYDPDCPIPPMFTTMDPCALREGLHSDAEMKIFTAGDNGITITGNGDLITHATMTGMVAEEPDPVVVEKVEDIPEPEPEEAPKHKSTLEYSVTKKTGSRRRNERRNTLTIYPNDVPVIDISSEIIEKIRNKETRSQINFSEIIDIEKLHCIMELVFDLNNKRGESEYESAKDLLVMMNIEEGIKYVEMKSRAALRELDNIVSVSTFAKFRAMVIVILACLDEARYVSVMKYVNIIETLDYVSDPTLPNLIIKDKDLDAEESTEEAVDTSSSTPDNKYPTLTQDDIKTVNELLVKFRYKTDDKNRVVLCTVDAFIEQAMKYLEPYYEAKEFTKIPLELLGLYLQIPHYVANNYDAKLDTLYFNNYRNLRAEYEFYRRSKNHGKH